MMSPVQRRRLFIIVFMMITGGVAVALILFALSRSIDLFYNPTQLKQIRVAPHKTIRIGGMVVKGSVRRGDGLQVRFRVTDFKNDLFVDYQGILPDLFREGQGVVALGKMDGEGIFQAEQVLAKHDEKYMPPEVATMLKMKT